MGKVTTTTTLDTTTTTNNTNNNNKKRKKKKGRPSLLDLQKRSLKQNTTPQKQKGKNNNKFQKQKPIPPKPNNKKPNLNNNSNTRRSTRRNPNPDDEELLLLLPPRDKRKKEKKLKHVLKLSEDERESDTNDNTNNNNNNNENNNCGSEEDEGNDDCALKKKRKIGSISKGSNTNNDIDDKDDEKPKPKTNNATNETAAQEETKVDEVVDNVGRVTPLPDKKLLLFILDRLQKKDTYGVFAEPVDPDELPDYLEVIDFPMDFGTVRKKLDDVSYASLEEFERDVYLISSNAMQYNAPDTIYFRQARSIHELAKKNFENLRLDSDGNELEPQAPTEPKRRGRPPTKNLKRPPGRPPLERANSTPCDSNPGPNSIQLNNHRSNIDSRKGPAVLQKYGSTGLPVQSLYGSCIGDTYVGWSTDRYERIEDITGTFGKGTPVKHGKKTSVLEDSRRNTYKLTCYKGESSVLTTFDGERKQLIAVGLHSELGYVRSLARFASKLGPIAWNVASRKIERCLPAGAKYGPGWAGESEAPTEWPTQRQSPAPVAQISRSHGDVSSLPTDVTVESTGDGSDKYSQGEKITRICTSTQPKIEDGPSQSLSPPAAANGTCSVSSSVISSNGAGPSLNASEASLSPNLDTKSNTLDSSSGDMKAVHPSQSKQSTNIQKHLNGLNGSYGLNFVAQMGKMNGVAKPSALSCQSNPPIVTVSRTETQGDTETKDLPPSSSADNNGCEESTSSENSSEIKRSDCLSNTELHQKVNSSPPDLNVGFQPPGSPGCGRAESVQPDLMLQL